jgi:secreted trypsin-like serine protease
MKSKILLMLILLIGIGISAFFMTGCTQDATPSDVDDAGIVNGHLLGNREQAAKSVVALVAELDEGQGLCTGSLIDDFTVLTAAHCVDHSPQRMVIVFGPEVKTASQDRMREVTGFSQNPKWKNATARGRGDLALVHFEGGIPSGFKPVALATKSVALSKGLEVLMMGYGVTNGLSHEGSGTIRATATTILGLLSPTEVMTDGRKSSVCFGDSGGPAFSAANGGAPKGKLVQWGVASSVTNDSCNEASVHTSVISYLTWIKTTSAKLQASAGRSDNSSSGSSVRRRRPIELISDDFDDASL